MISMSMFLSVKVLVEEGLPKKTIARRLALDVRTVRWYVKLIKGGAAAPRERRVVVDEYARVFPCDPDPGGAGGGWGGAECVEPEWDSGAGGRRGAGANERRNRLGRAGA